MSRVVLVDADNRIADLGDDPGQVPDGWGDLEPSGIPFATARR